MCKMNTNKSLAFGAMLLITVAMVSCGNREKAHQDQLNYDKNEGEFPEMSCSSDTLTTGQYHQMILNAIANGNKALFAEMICYPLHREYPLADIKDIQQMIGYFDTLFDVTFRKRVAKLDSNSWEQVGWRGWMILDGEIWDTDPCIVINYSSPLEQRHAESLMKKDMSRLHPSLQDKWKPFECYFLDGSTSPDFEYSYARIDVSTDLVSEDGEPVYRLSLFKKESNASDAPSLVLMGNREIEGSMHIVTFYFDSEDYYICIDPQNIEDGKSYFAMTIKGKTDKKIVVPCKSQMQPF